MRANYDYLITDDGIKPLTTLESKFWVLLKEHKRNKKKLTYDKAIMELYGLRTTNITTKYNFIQAISIIQNKLNKKIDGLIVRKMNSYFEYLSKEEILKIAEKERIWRKSHKSSKG